jgi:prevent-host-death family protein
MLPVSKFSPKSVSLMSQSILSLSEFKADASRLLDRLRDEPATLVLTQNGRARAVVEDYDQYQARERALLMLKLMAQGERDAADGRLSEQEQVFTDLRRRLVSGEPEDG